jgi:hippurate hydrolase
MGVDAILVGSQIVQSLQSIVARSLDPALNGVVSVTEFVADGKRNVLAGNATLRGDARALSPAVDEAIEARMRAIVAGVALAHGIEATVSYDTIFPAVVNHPAAVAAAVAAVRSIAPAERVDGQCEARLFSEDFAHLAAARPGCFVLIGNGTQGQHARALHSADYDFNDDALVHGSSLWARLVEQRLPA